MRQINHSVTVLRVRREEWLKAAENRYVLCDHAIPYDRVAIIFIDSTTGEHYGDARIVSETTFGGYENGNWTWSMFAKLTGLTVRELKERFPFEAKLPYHDECEMYLYEIEPICESELRSLLYSPEE